MDDDNKLMEYSSELYDVIRNKFNKITMVDTDGGETIDETQAVQFDIQMGTDVVTISLVTPEVVTVLYDKGMLTGRNPETQSQWEDLVNDLRKFTVAKNLKFDLHPTDRPLSGVDKEKLIVQAKKEVSESRFSKWDGSKRSSWQGLEKVRVKVRHKKTVDETVQGARTRNVSRVFIETAEGERFKFPYPLLDGARAMARHLEEGGNWNDRIGQHILDLSEKVMTIKRFAKQARKSGVTESALPVVVRLSEKLDEYKKKLTMMQGSRGYHSYKKTMVETYIEPVDHFAGMFAKVDEDLMQLMPFVERILGERENAGMVNESISKFVSWINK